MEMWRWMAFAICMVVGFASRRYLEVPLMRVKFIHNFIRSSKPQKKPLPNND